MHMYHACPKSNDLQGAQQFVRQVLASSDDQAEFAQSLVFILLYDSVWRTLGLDNPRSLMAICIPGCNRPVQQIFGQRS
jgi:hypothetical protein